MYSFRYLQLYILLNIKMFQVAVLLPVYKKDNPQFFTTTVASLLSQSYKDFTIFLGVDGPIEGELDSMIKDCEQNSKFCVCRFTKNRGLACVLNDLIAEAVKLGFVYFARMDADDVCVNTRLEKQLIFLQNHPEVDVVGGKIEEIDENGSRNGKTVFYPLSHDACKKYFRYRDPLAHPATFFRKRYFDKAKGYRPEYRKNQDTMLWFDGFMNGCIFANLDETVLLFRVTDDFYKNRRNGFKRAKKMLEDRFMINKALHYDWSAYLFSFLMFIMTLTPPFLKKFLYRIR